MSCVQMTQTVEKSPVKKMEKGEVTIMEPNTTGEGYHEVVITKNFWKCLTCGRVWAMRHDAQNCGNNAHRDFYIKRYGGYYSMGRHIGGREVTFRIIRKGA